MIPRLLQIPPRLQQDAPIHVGFIGTGVHFQCGLIRRGRGRRRPLPFGDNPQHHVGEVRPETHGLKPLGRLSWAPPQDGQGPLEGLPGPIQIARFKSLNPQLEPRPGVARRLPDLGPAQPEVASALFGPETGIDNAVMVNGHGQVGDLSSAFHEALVHHFVDPSPEANLRRPPEEPNLVRGIPAGDLRARRAGLKGRILAGARRKPGAVDLVRVIARGHPVSGDIASLKRPPQGLQILWSDGLVRVQDENPILRRPVDGRISRRGEIVFPGDLDDPRAEFPGDLRRAVGRARIHNHDFGDQFLDAPDASGQALCLVADNHAKGHPSPAAVGAGH